MTTVTLPRATVEQALEALESVQPQNMGPLIHPAKQALRAALAQQAEPVEPVAVFDERMGCPVLLPGAPMLKDAQPLYTAPPQRKPLTEEEINEIAQTNLGDYRDGEWHLLFARAIERAHGIGEEK